MRLMTLRSSELMALHPVAEAVYLVFCQKLIRQRHHAKNNANHSSHSEDVSPTK
jgi:hypothetical protein